MVLTRNERYRNMWRNMGIYSRSLRNQQQPSAKAPGCFGMRRTRPAESRPFAPSNATHWHTVNYDNMPAPNRTVNFLQLSLRQELPFDGLAHLMRSGHQGFSRLLPGGAPFFPHCGNARADFLFQKVMLPICRTEWKKPYLPTRILDYR